MKKQAGQTPGRLTFVQKYLLTVATVGLSLLLYFAWFPLLLLFASLLWGIFLRRSAMSVMQAVPISFPVALSALLLVLLTGTGYFAYSFGTMLAEQFNVFVRELGEAGQHVTRRLHDYEWGRAVAEATPTLGAALGGEGSLFPMVKDGLTTMISLLVSSVVVAVGGIYFAIDSEAYQAGLVKCMPHRFRATGEILLNELGETLWQWLKGRLFSMIVVGVLSAILLFALDIQAPIANAVFAFLFNFIPNLGPLIALAPPVLLAGLHSWSKIVWVILGYSVLQLIESYLLTPIVQKHQVRLRPMVIVGAQVLLGSLTGLLGLALATPLVAGVHVIAKQLYFPSRAADGAPNGRQPQTNK